MENDVNILQIPTTILQDVFDRAGYDYDWSTTYISRSSDFPFACEITPQALDIFSGGWGIILCMSHDKCRNAAAAIDDLGLLPEGCDYILCLDDDTPPRKCHPETLARALSEIGLACVYIENGLRDECPDKWVVSSNDLVIQDVSQSHFLVSYLGSPDNLGKEQREDLVHLHRQECVATHELALRRTALRLLKKWPATSDITKAVNTICFEYQDRLEDLNFDYKRYERAVRFRCRIAPSLFQQLEKHDIASQWIKYAQKQEQTFSDCVTIWSAALNKWKVSLGEYEVEDLDMLTELGEVLGIKSAIMAYFSGVPLSDIHS